VAFLLLACLGLGAVGYVASRTAKDSAATGAPTTLPTAAPTDEPSFADPTVSPAPTHTGSLAKYLVPVPPGAHKWPTKPLVQELPDLATASNNQPAFKAVLSQYGFQRGYAHRWIDRKGTIVDVRVFQFDGTEDAADFAQIMGESGILAGWSDPKPVPGADGAVMQIQTKKDKYGRILSKGVVVGGDLVAMIEYYAPPPNDPKRLATLLTQESRLLH
jgi:hypothetical protein